MKTSKRQLKRIIREAIKESMLEESRYRGKNYRSKQVLDDMTYGDSGPTELYKPADPIRGPGNVYMSIRSRESAMAHGRAQVAHVIQALGLDPIRATFHPETRKMGELERAMNTYGYMIDYNPSKMTITFENKSDTSHPYVLNVSHLKKVEAKPMNESRYSYEDDKRRRRREYEMQDPGYYPDSNPVSSGEPVAVKRQEEPIFSVEADHSNLDVINYDEAKADNSGYGGPKGILANKRDEMMKQLYPEESDIELEYGSISRTPYAFMTAIRDEPYPAVFTGRSKPSAAQAKAYMDAGYRLVFAYNSRGEMAAFNLENIAGLHRHQRKMSRMR